MHFSLKWKYSHLKVTVVEVGWQVELLWRRVENAYYGSQVAESIKAS
jgi:hypothetical protein